MNLTLEKKQNIIREVRSILPEKVTLEVGNDNKVEVWWEDKIGFNNFIGDFDFNRLVICSDEIIYSTISTMISNFKKVKKLQEMILYTSSEMYSNSESVKIYLKEYLDLLKKM